MRQLVEVLVRVLAFLFFFLFLGLRQWIYTLLRFMRPTNLFYEFYLFKLEHFLIRYNLFNKNTYIFDIGLF